LSPQPIVLVIIPAYNESENIDRCLKSVMNQDYVGIRVFVQDNQSTDDTYSKIRLISDNQSKIAVSRLDKHVTSSENWKSATDTAMQMFESQFIIYLAADDYFSDSSYIGNLVNKSILEPKVIFVPIFEYRKNAIESPVQTIVLKTIQSKFVVFRIFKFLTSWNYVHAMYGLFPRTWFVKNFKDNKSKYTSSAASDWWWIFYALMDFKLKVARDTIYVRNTRTRVSQTSNISKISVISPKEGILNNKLLFSYTVSFPRRLILRGFSIYRLLFQDNERYMDPKSIYLIIAKSVFITKALKNIISDFKLTFFSKASWTKIFRSKEH
jgi:glycosyltransferase involved in cell wall biosynthesis